MKNLITVSVYTLFISWLSLAWVPHNTSAAAGSATHVKDSLNNSIGQLYNEFQLEEKGLSEEAFAYACKGYYKLLEKKMIHEGVLTICDMSQSSRHKRLYILDMVNHEVELNTYVAHGRNSGGEYATRFSNKPSSLQSSLGFYVTRNTYNGEHGLSLRIEGVEPGYNNNAMGRAIVVHGANYMEENWLHSSTYMGRSYGCPAVPQKESSQIINTIKNGNCLFIYHPSAKYLKGSKILNG